MTQTGLIERIAEATGLTNANPNHTPTNQDALGKDLEGPVMTDTWSYRSIVGMLLYQIGRASCRERVWSDV